MPTFNELLKQKIEKFNPYHDSRGRFSSANGAASMTIRTKDPNKQHMADLAIQREKERAVTAAVAPTAAQEKELTRIANRTRNLKKEQLRVVDSEGNVVMQKQGGRGEVLFTVGEARDNFPGNITIHNHPDGGTFSAEDLRSLGYGAKEIRVAAPEGDYSLRPAKLSRSGAPDGTGWYDLNEGLQEAELSFKSQIKLKSTAREPFMQDYKEKVQVHSDNWAKARESGASMEEQQKHIDAFNKANDAWKAENQPKIEAEVRRLYTKQYHDYYTENASKFGLEYTFTPTVKKSINMEILNMEDNKIMKSDDNVVLDADFNKTIKDITEEIMNDITMKNITGEE